MLSSSADTLPYITTGLTMTWWPPRCASSDAIACIPIWWDRARGVGRTRMFPALHTVLTAHRVHASTIHSRGLHRRFRSFALRRLFDIAWMAERASTQ